MKNLITKIAIIISMHLISLNVYAHVEIDYPVGGETFNPGQIITIQWHIAIPHNTLNWDVLFSSDGGMTWSPVQMDVPANQLSLTWQVPSTITTMARISVIQDNDGMDYQDESMNFTIQNAMLPMLTVPASNITLECDAQNQEDFIQQWLDAHGGAVVTNFCADLNWAHDFISLSNQCGATGSATVTFTATDECGSTETSAVLSVVDNSPPLVGNQAQNLTVECPDQNNLIQVWLQSHGGATAADDCGSITWTNDFTTPDPCSAAMSRTVTFTAVDECGNNSTTSATLTTQVITSTDSDIDLSKFELYPNPVREELHIELNEERSFQLSLHSMNGSEMHTQSFLGKGMIPTGDLLSGMYLVKITTHTSTEFRLVVVQH